MELEKLNKILGKLKNNPNLQFVARQNIHLGVSESSYQEGVQGEEDRYYEIYKILEEDLFVRIEFFTDSYGESPSITGINFVKKQTKTIETYEVL